MSEGSARLRRYEVAGTTLLSSIPLPELGGISVRNIEPTLVFRLGEPRPQEELPLPYNDVKNTDGSTWLSFVRNNGRYVLRFPELADFSVDTTRQEIYCAPMPDTRRDTIRHLLLDQVVPAVLAKNGAVVLHASAVLTPWGVVAFLGPSGFGKSTLALSFASIGFPAIADDFLVLEESDGRFVATPSYPGVRLWKDSAEQLAPNSGPRRSVAEYTRKRRIVPPTSDMTVGPERLISIITLAEEDLEIGQPPNLSRVPARDAFMAVYQQAFRLDPSGAERQVAEFDQFNRLIDAVPVSKLFFRHDWAELPSTREAILSAICAPE